MPIVDYGSRQLLAANEVLRIIKRERPESIRQLRSREEVFGFDDAGHKAVADWCEELRLGCDAIRTAAFFCALETEDDDALHGTEPLPNEDEDAPHYWIAYIPGESQKRFLARALREFRRKQSEERVRGVVAASDRLNSKHVEWLVRFQVHQQGFDTIARAYGAGRSDIKRAVRSLASLLELKLRPNPPGRPKGRRASKRPAHHVVRQGAKHP